MIPGELTPPQLDALRELGNIGMGHAATALSQLLGRTIHLQVPRATVTDLAQVPELLGGAERIVAGIALEMTGEVHGNILLVFSEESVQRLVGQLLGPDEETSPDTPLGSSTLLEVGNIIASAYLNALGALLGMTLLPSVPQLSVDMAGAVVDAVLIELGASGNQALLLETEFFHPGDSTAAICGHFFLLPDPHCLDAILSAVEVSP